MIIMGIIHNRFIERQRMKIKPTLTNTTAKDSVKKANNRIMFIRCERFMEWGTFGPWTAAVHDDSLTAITNRYKDNLPMMPEPAEEGLTMNAGLLVGFELKDLLRWFPNPTISRELEKAGFSYVCYSIPEDKIQIGKTQVVFHPDNACPVAKVHYNFLYEMYENEILSGKIS